MAAFYSEHEPFAAQWLRNLIAAGHIAPGVVDERDIWDIAPEELDPYEQVHLFAGIGIWSHALRSAGWPDGRPVWTASCPCQPFSAAGARAGFADERHAWPAVLWFLQARRPCTLFGEQVSSKDGLAWFDVVQSDLDGEGYTVGGIDTCAASVGAPHIRQRLYWVADTDHEGLEGRRCPQRSAQREDRQADSLRDASEAFWTECDWLSCRDGKQRPTESGVLPLASRNPGDVGRLRAYGNSLCAPQAAAFVSSYMDEN